MMRVVLVVTLVGCGGGSGNKEAAEGLSVSLSGVGLAATKVMYALDDLHRTTEMAKLRPSNAGRGPEVMQKFNVVAKEVIELGKEVTNQKRLAAEGDLKACSDAWYPAADGLKDALDPFIAWVLKGGSGEERKLSDAFQMRIEWSKVEKPVIDKLCDLKRAGLKCAALFDAEGVPAPGTKTMGGVTRFCK